MKDNYLDLRLLQEKEEEMSHSNQTKCENCLETKDHAQHGHCQDCIDMMDSSSSCCDSGYDEDYQICGSCHDHCVSAWDDILIEKIGFDEWYATKGSK